MVTYKATKIESEARDKERKYEVKWKQKDRKYLRTEFNTRLLLALSTQAVSHEWNGQFQTTGYIFVSKLDVTTNILCLYRAHPGYNGEEWYDWGLFHSTNSSRVKHKVNAGLILGR